MRAHYGFMSQIKIIQRKNAKNVSQRIYTHTQKEVTFLEIFWNIAYSFLKSSQQDHKHYRRPLSELPVYTTLPAKSMHAGVDTVCNSVLRWSGVLYISTRRQKKNKYFIHKTYTYKQHNNCVFWRARSYMRTIKLTKERGHYTDLREQYSTNCIRKKRLCSLWPF